MRIKTIISQHRRDFHAIYECEHCGYEMKKYGYDDTNFHKNVIPKMKCPDCNKIASDDYRPLATTTVRWRRNTPTRRPYDLGDTPHHANL